MKIRIFSAINYKNQSFMVNSTSSVKKVVKATIYFALTLLISFHFSCTSEDGQNGSDGLQGPQGEQGIAGQDGGDGADGTNGTDGADGADGTNGTDGEDGNANVIQYTFPLFTHNGTDQTLTIPLSRSDIEESAVLVYVNPGGLWYPLPGIIGETYEYRLLFNSFVSTTDIVIRRVSGGEEDHIINSTRILVIPASQIIVAKGQGVNVNKMTYDEVMEHFDLEY